MTINFSELSFEELQDVVEQGKQEMRKRYYGLAIKKSKKVYDDLQELKIFIKGMGGDINTALNSSYLSATLDDCLDLFDKYFDPMSFFPDEFFD